ncbi:MAG TPA: 3'-5' exonuclease, partial [Candidatus Eremiobacteraceae bacterium]|nr:3'-5' exonuclease [Candidatus Eremiobacteraceae bacterium]
HPLRHLLATHDGRQVREWSQTLASDQRITYLDPVTAHLVAGGDTFYRGLRFGQLRRLQFDLETLDVYPDRDDAAICIIAVRDDDGFERVLALDEFPNEASMIAEFARIMRERDPDIIEGHNVFNFDLWYLHERARRFGVPLILGRDGRTPLWLDESIRRSVPAGMSCKYYRIEGRQIVDTFLGVMRWDVGRKLPNYKLKQVVRHLGIGDESRAMVDAANMRALWNDPRQRAQLKAYCLDDTRDTARLSALVTPNEFYQVQMVPESLQGLAFVGIGSRIERLMVRAYLRANHSIPRPRPTAPTEGGFTAAFATGVFRDVAKCDVESLYPSLMIARGIRPEDDDLDVFLPMLAELRSRRVDVKRASASALAEDRADDHRAADGLQNALKILVNSFYGFLGTNGLHFNDPAAAGRVTEAGRGVMMRIVEELRTSGATVIEADTDGAYFVTPYGADPEALVERVGATLGDGLNLVFEERYSAMLSLKAKNYALARKDGTLVMRGSALRSSRDEPFGRALMREIVSALFAGQPESIERIVESTIAAVKGGSMGVDEFARRESVTSKTFNAPANRRLAQALAKRGVAIGDKVRIYQRSDGELTLAEEYADDEDREYLLRRVEDFVARFGEIIPIEARRAASKDPDQLTLL